MLFVPQHSSWLSSSRSFLRQSTPPPLRGKSRCVPRTQPVRSRKPLLRPLVRMCSSRRSPGLMLHLAWARSRRSRRCRLRASETPWTALGLPNTSRHLVWAQPGFCRPGGSGFFCNTYSRVFRHKYFSRREHFLRYKRHQHKLRCARSQFPVSLSHIVSIAMFGSNHFVQQLLASVLGGNDVLDLCHFNSDSSSCHSSSGIKNDYVTALHETPSVIKGGLVASFDVSLDKGFCCPQLFCCSDFVVCSDSHSACSPVSEQPVHHSNFQADHDSCALGASGLCSHCPFCLRADNTGDSAWAQSCAFCAGARLSATDSLSPAVGGVDRLPTHWPRGAAAPSVIAEEPAALNPPEGSRCAPGGQGVCSGHPSHCGDGGGSFDVWKLRPQQDCAQILSLDLLVALPDCRIDSCSSMPQLSCFQVLVDHCGDSHPSIVQPVRCGANPHLDLRQVKLFSKHPSQ